MAGLNHRVVAEGLCIFNDIFQFAYIPGIIVTVEDGQCFRRDGCDAPRGSGMPGKNMTNQQGDVVHALTQGGDVQRDDIEAIVEIFPESACFDFFLKIETGRGQDADVNGDFTRSADTEKLFLLEDPQEFDLR